MLSIVPALQVAAALVLTASASVGAAVTLGCSRTSRRHTAEVRGRRAE